MKRVHYEKPPKMLKNTLIIFLLAFAYSFAQHDSVTMHEQGVLRTHNNAQIGIFGDLTNHGVFNVNDGGEVGFYNQNREQQIVGTNRPIIYSMKIDTPQDLNLQVGVDVINNVDFIEGRVLTARNRTDVSLDIFNDNAYEGASDTNHVDGFTSRDGSENYVFPVGDDFRLRPIEIITNGNLALYKAAYFYEDAAGFNAYNKRFDRQEKNNFLGRVSPFEFWYIDHEKVNSTEVSQDIQVTLTWDRFSNIEDLIGGKDLKNLRVAGWHKDQQRWLDLGKFTTEGDVSEGKISSDPINVDLYEVVTFASLINTEAEVLVYNGVSAGEDGANDYLVIANVRDLPNNKLTIFNRWGVVVYEQEGYDADDRRFVPNPKYRFDGTSQGRSTIKADEKLPVGTYFYIFEYAENENSPRKSTSGYLYLTR